MTAEPTATHEAGVVGSPIRHSLSPLLHRAAYRALGLSGWSYHRDEVGAGALAEYLAALPDSWVGLSVTMPGKEEALRLGDVVTEEARLTGAANTLVRRDGAWRADNSDVHGLLAAFADAGCRRARSAWVVGSGATARSALVAMHRMGVQRVVLHVRSAVREPTHRLAGDLGMTVLARTYDDGWPDLADIDVAVSTVPAGTAPEPRAWPPGLGLPHGHRLWALDVAYQQHSDWAQRLAAAGAVVVPGVDMLLHQAARQVEAMTGRPAPVEAMRGALAAHRVTAR